MKTECISPFDADLAGIYAADGAVPVRKLIGQAWIDALLPAAHAVIDRAQQDAADSGLPPDLKNLWQREPLFHRFAVESGVAEGAARVVQSHQMQLVIDQIWTKDAQSSHRTRWHYDYAAWPVTGLMLPSVWLALTPISAENCLTFVAGSHLLPRDLQTTVFTDYDAPRSEARFLAWDLNPGDAVIFHPLAYHGCRGNTAPRRRVALTTRWAGDDIRYDPTRSYIDEGLSFSDCRAGEPLRGPHFPLMGA